MGDTDGNGYLSFEGFVQAWRFLGEEGTIEEMRRAFSEVDIDGSGQIDWYEFAEAILGTDSGHQSIKYDLQELSVILEEFKSLIRRRNKYSEINKRFQSELTTERSKLDEIENEKMNLLAKIQQLK